ncbi:MAG: N-acetyltransferase family protein [Actinomycetota bacterium]|nr:N-acetyltransferase family protein [Actinomycetota bacterium]
MGEALEVRDAQPGDVAAIARIFAPYALETVLTFEMVALTDREWHDRLGAARRARHPFLVATLDSAVIGYAYVTPWKAKPGYSHTVENSIYLAAEYAGRGYGRALLGELLVRAAAVGLRQVIAVIADSGSPASQALHRSAGFTEAGRLRRVGCKHGRWIDTVLMQRSLG